MQNAPTVDLARDEFREGFALHHRGDLAGAEERYRRVVALTPGHFGALHLLGVIAAQTGRPQMGLDLISNAIRLNGAVSAMHSDLGLILKDLGRPEEALASFDEAISLKPDFAAAFFNRGIAMKALDRFEEAIESYDRAIALKPDYIEAHINRGNVFAAMGRLDEAIDAHDRALALAPGHAGVLWSKSYLLLSRGQFDAGWALYEFRRKTRQPGADRGRAIPQWSGAEDIAGKTLFLHWEQGFGDTLFFCRYAALAKARGALVVLSVQDPLVRLMTSPGSGIEIVGGGEEPDTCDFHCPLMSLPRAFGTTLDTIPAGPFYLSADPDLTSVWRARLPQTPRRRIGLAWSGNPTHDNDRHRSIALASLRPLLSEDFDWFCLQKDVRPSDEAALRDIGRIHVFGDALTDFADTAAIIDLMDLVITVDTGVAHLAGALGKPVWVLLPFMPDFRWLLDRDDSPWYPSARLYRQVSIGDWSPVIERVRLDLAGP